MGSLSPIHWILVVVIVLLLFGPSRLAGLGKGLGEGIRALKKGVVGKSDAAEEDPKRL